MTVSITITDEDHGWNSLTTGLTLLGKSKIKAGLFTAKQAQKGHWLEFGFKHAAAGPISPRPWASKAGDEGAPVFGTAMGVAIGRVLDGKDPHDALDPVGEIVADTMAAVITNREVGGDDLADSTVDAKGHAVKGVDSGDMVAAITWKVTP